MLALAVLQWPTILTLAMFPVLVTMYVLLARREEREVLAEFGEVYARYAERTPRFFPRLGGRSETQGPTMREGGPSRGAS